jgi:dienelactone hydrolase
MRTIFLLFAAFLLVSVNTIAQNVFNPLDTQARHNPLMPYGSRNNPNPSRTGLQKWVSTPTNGVSTAYDASSYKAYFINATGKRMAFRIKFPKSFSNPDSVNKRYPLMLFFHGAGEPGCSTNGGIYNNEKQLLHGGKLFMDRVDSNLFDGFLLYPQAVVTADCSNFWGTAYDNVILATLDSLIKYTRVDIDRVFVNGLSDGGRTTWRFARTFPQRVARVAPSAMSAMTTNLSSMIHIPVWFASGGRDSNPSPAQAQETLTTFSNLGGNIRYTIFPELGHGVWNQHWNEPDYVPFMNGTHKANPLVYFQRYEWCAGAPISAKMGVTPGYYAYEWQKDNIVIARRTNGVNTIVVPASIVSYTGNEITVKSYGTYRVRFQRTATSAWSVWSPQPVVLKTKAITQTAPITIAGTRTHILPAPDGSTTVPLTLPAGFLNYQWYRVSDNVLVSSVQTFNAPVGQYRARYSERFGCGTLFSPVFNVVSANGSPKPGQVTNLSAVAILETVIQLTWNNPVSATNETGFEIYRGAKPGGPYVLQGTVRADSLSYQDKGLTPNVNYYYIVRAITATGAAAISNEASSKTIKDVLPPTAPEDVQYRGSTQYSVALRWNSSIDNIGIKRYDIYINGIKHYSTTGTSYTVRGLDSLTTYAFTIRAVDSAGNQSAPSAQVLGYTHRQGLNYKYYQGTFSTLPNFNTLTPVKSGITDSVNTGITIRNQIDNYAILWQGYIYIPMTGTYVFEINSDEGSRLYIDVPYSFNATPLINNDGVHTAVNKTGEITLARGYHSIAVSYFERSGTEALELYWSNNAGITRRRIADNFFSFVNVESTPPLIAPSSLTVEATAYNRIVLNWADLSGNETGFEIVRSLTSAGTFESVGTVPANTTSFINTGLASSTDYYYKVRAIGETNESPYTDQQFAITPAAPGTPVAPTNLDAENISPSFIALSWMDNSKVETNFQVWRSTDNITFELRATLPANSNTYTDNAVTPFAQYYYYVVGINALGNGTRSEILAVIAGNNAPVISAVSDMFVKTDATISQDFTINDPGDNLTVSIPNKPPFLRLQSLGGSSYRIIAEPTVNNIGWFNCLVSAKDSKGAITTTPFRVTVADKNTRSVYVNVGSAFETAPAPWNNWPGLRAAGHTMINLKDETNTITPFGITTVNGWAFLTDLGHITGNDSGVLPDSVLMSGIADSSIAVRQITINGLDPAMRYNIVFVGSQNEGLPSTTEYSTGSQRDTLNARYNTNQSANLNSLVPDAGGQITVNIRKLSGLTYLNAIVIEEYLPTITLLNPVNLYAEAADRTIIDITWSDRTNNESATDGYELTRATDSLFTNTEAVILLPGNTSRYRNTGLSANKKYWYRVRAKLGSSYSDFSNFARTITPANIVAVNFNVAVPDAPAPWNNTASSPNAFTTFSGLINQSGLISGISLRIEQQFNGEFTAGMSTGNNSGIVPDNALLGNYWIDKTQLAQIRVSGLNQTRRYRFGFFGSSSPNGWYKGDYTATYSINGRTVYLNSWSNNSKIVYIGDVVPDDGGEVLLNFSTTQAALYAFNGGVLIEDYTDMQGGNALNSVLEEEIPVTPAGPELRKGRAYPNPFLEGFSVDIYNNSAANKVSAEIYDMTGRRIYYRNFNNTSEGNNTLRIEPEQVSIKPGVYIVMVKINGRIVQTNKMIRAKQ